MEGRNLFQESDPSAAEQIRREHQLAREKDGVWTAGLWPKPGQKKPQKKMSFLRPIKVDGRDYTVGSGLYLQ